MRWCTWGGLTPDYETIADAVGSFGVDEEGTVIVHAGMTDYNESVVVDSGRTIGILAAELGAEVVPPRWIRSSGGTPQLSVVAGATVLLDGLQLSSNASSSNPAVLVDGGRAWLDRSRVVQNSGGGVVAQSSAELVLRNCFVGAGIDDVDAVHIDGATATLQYSTLGAGSNNAAALACTSPVLVDVRNSILVSRGSEASGGLDVACDEANISFSATERMFAGDGNQAVGEMPSMNPELWFVDYGIGEFHLQNQGLFTFADISRWGTGDPLTDIDGDPRPAVDGTSDVAGADRPFAAARPELIQ